MEISVQRKPLNNKELNSIGGRVPPEERKCNFAFNFFRGIPITFEHFSDPSPLPLCDILVSRFNNLKKPL